MEASSQRGASSGQLASGFTYASEATTASMVRFFASERTFVHHNRGRPSPPFGTANRASIPRLQEAYEIFILATASTVEHQQITYQKIVITRSRQSRLSPSSFVVLARSQFH
jgi:hypothetical protein